MAARDGEVYDNYVYDNHYEGIFLEWNVSNTYITMS